MNLKAIACLAAMIGTPLAAEDEIRPGCYERIYSAEHLEKNPQQGVAALRLGLYAPDGGLGLSFGIDATMADQGQGRADGVAGQTLSTGGVCNPNSNRMCGADGDIGQITVVNQTSKSLTFRTGGVVLGDWEIGGPTTSLSENTGADVTYLVYAVPDDRCADIF